MKKSNNEKYYFILNKIYILFSGLFFWVFRYIIILISMYCNINVENLEWIQNKCFLIYFLVDVMGIINNPIGDSSILVSIIVVVWTFTLSISVYCLGKLDSLFFGIRLTEIMTSFLLPRKIIFITFTVLSEIIFLFFAVVFDLNFVIFVIGILQFLSMLYAVLMIYIETSRYTVIDRIQRGIMEENDDSVKKKKIKNWRRLLSCMLKNLDYSDSEDVEKLYDLLSETISDVYKNDWFEIYKVSEKILSVNKNKEYREDFIQRWMLSTEKMEGNQGILIKQGIFAAVIKYLSVENYHYLLKLFDVQQNNYNRIIIWCVAVNIYFEKYDNEHWRGIFTKKMIKFHLNEWKKEDIDLFYASLKQISKKFDSIYESTQSSFFYVYKYFQPYED